jgi:hypothetical protein
MTNSSEQGGGHGIEDEALPADVRPGEDNPLAEALEDAETAGDLAPGELLEEGKKPEEREEDEDQESPEDRPD